MRRYLDLPGVQLENVDRRYPYCTPGHSQYRDGSHSMADAKLVLVDEIESRILEIRGQKVLLDNDLASLYGGQRRC